MREDAARASASGHLQHPSLHPAEQHAQLSPHVPCAPAAVRSGECVPSRSTPRTHAARGAVRAAGAGGRRRRGQRFAVAALDATVAPAGAPARAVVAALARHGGGGGLRTPGPTSADPPPGRPSWARAGSKPRQGRPRLPRHLRRVHSALTDRSTSPEAGASGPRSAPALTLLVDAHLRVPARGRSRLA